jgi:putative sterol carrier protein
LDIPAITEAMRAKMGDESGLDAVLKFDCGADGVIVLDARASPNQAHNQDVEADCTVHISREDLLRLMSGQMNPMMGYMSGKFTVSGDLRVAMKLQKVV